MKHEGRIVNLVTVQPEIRDTDLQTWHLIPYWTEHAHQAHALVALKATPVAAPSRVRR